MLLRTIRPFILSYWITLHNLRHGRLELEHTLDLPLPLAVKRAWSSAAWSTLWTLVLLFVTHSFWINELPSQYKEWLWGMIPGLFIVGTILVYGILRLYILVSHVIATNIFKVKGQRLRWLNQQTAILSLTFPLCIAYMIYTVNHWIGALSLGAVILYIILLSIRTCHLVFHTDDLHGFFFFLKLNIVSWFVTAICMMAFLVALFILGLVALAVIRLFIR